MLPFFPRPMARAHVPFPRGPFTRFLLGRRCRWKKIRFYIRTRDDSIGWRESLPSRRGGKVQKRRGKSHPVTAVVSAGHIFGCFENRITMACGVPVLDQWSSPKAVLLSFSLPLVTSVKTSDHIKIGSY
jgi:hypothetical protein